jgi:predicted CXXCH cytochrome family protein
MVGLAASGATAQGVPQDQACVTCHLGLDEDRLSSPARDYEEDLHTAVGFGCLDCHGPGADGDHPPDPSAGFLSKPDRRNVSRLCGQCHSDAQFMRDFNPSLRVDQETEYATSVHGDRLMRLGDTAVAVCVSCHPAHRIKPPSDPQSSVHPLNVAGTCVECHGDEAVMAPYDIPTDQHVLYERSVHWQWMVEEADLSAPTCNDCHGNHGAAPPGISSVQNVCGQCHSVMADFFTEGAHAEYFAESDLPACATCHSNHDIETPDDEMLLTFADSVCMKCHAEGEVGADDFPVMKTLIDSLELELARSHETLLEAENRGMEVSQALFDLEESTTSLVKARTAIHSFIADSVRIEIDAGLAVAAAAQERGQGALGEHLFRRQGLAVSVALILICVIGLSLKIKEMERRSTSATSPKIQREG